MNPRDTYGYAIFDKNGSMGVFSHKMPIFWYRKVARNECPPGFTVRKISISEPTDEVTK